MNNTEGNVHEASDLRIYEVGYHLMPKVAEGDVPAEVERIKSILSTHGASVIAEEMPRMTQLSYPMTRTSAGRREYFSQAHFGWIKFEVDPSQAKLIEEEINRNEKVLRSLMISTVRESTLSKKVFVSERPISETRKPQAEKEEKKLTEAEIETAVDTLVAEVAPEEKPAEA